MDENKINILNKKLNRLNDDIQDAKDYHFLLYNSLLTFNGILLTAFALMVTLKPSAYSPFVVPYFVLSIFTITTILILIYQARQYSLSSAYETIKELADDLPDFRESHPEMNKWPKKKRRNDRLAIFFDAVVIVLSILNPIFIFVILYVAPKC